MRISFKRSISSFGALLLAAIAPATTLTFNGLGLSDFSPIPSSLGSNASAPAAGYVQGAGWTPNVTVSMSTVFLDGTVFDPNLSYWGSSYGSLTGVAYPTSNGYYARVTLTAAPGFLVKINSFKIAGYPTTDRLTPVVRVSNQNGTVLWNADGAVAPGSGFSVLTPNVEASQLTFLIGNDWNVAFDDFDFTQRAADGSSNTTGIVDFGQLGGTPYNSGTNLPTSIPVSFRDASNTEIATGSATYNPVTGAFSANVPGSVTVPYRVSFKHGFWLRKTMPNPVDPAAPLGNYAFGSVAPAVGDADDDNAVTPSDYGIWQVANGTFPTENTSADFDGDGAVTPSDYGLWQINNGAFGDD